MNKSHILSIIGLAALASCRPSLKSDLPSAGQLDLSQYVAVGSAHTAGSADQSLYRSGQENSFPAILAGQFRLVDGGEFIQPLLNGENGYPNPRLVLGTTTDCMGATALGPVTYNGSIDTTGEGIPADGTPNNLGIPGVRTIDYLMPGYPMLNPYAARISKTGMEAPVEIAMRKNPTFFSVWLGLDDVLGYAMTGGEQHADPMHPNNISNPDLFRTAYDSLVRVMTRGAAKGVLLNIPSIAHLPFFTTIPANGLMLDADQAAQLNGLHGASGVTFTAGANYFLVEDPEVPVYKYRKMKAGEYILLSIPQDSMKCGGWGSARPIPKKYVLTSEEVAKIKAAISEFNNFIRAEAIQYKLAYADMDLFFQSLASGIKYNGVDYSAQYIAGGAFSLDALHLTPRGNAMIANELIRVINSYYTSAVPYVDANKFSGIRLP